MKEIIVMRFMTALGVQELELHNPYGFALKELLVILDASDSLDARAKSLLKNGWLLSSKTRRA